MINEEQFRDVIDELVAITCYTPEDTVCARLVSMLAKHVGRLRPSFVNRLTVMLNSSIRTMYDRIIHPVSVTVDIGHVIALLDLIEAADALLAVVPAKDLFDELCGPPMILAWHLAARYSLPRVHAIMRVARIAVATTRGRGDWSFDYFLYPVIHRSRPVQPDWPPISYATLYELANTVERDQIERLVEIKCLCAQVALVTFGLIGRLLDWLNDRFDERVCSYLLHLIRLTDAVLSEEEMYWLGNLLSTRATDCPAYRALIGHCFMFDPSAATPLFVSLFHAYSFYGWENRQVFHRPIAAFFMERLPAQSRWVQCVKKRQHAADYRDYVLARAIELAIGLQSMRLPTLVLLEILDQHLPYEPLTMHTKWQYLVAVRHWHQRHDTLQLDT